MWVLINHQYWHQLHRLWANSTHLGFCLYRVQVFRLQHHDKHIEYGLLNFNSSTDSEKMIKIFFFEHYVKKWRNKTPVERKSCIFILNRYIHTGAFLNFNNEKYFFGITFTCGSLQKDFWLSNATMVECSAVFVSVLSISLLLEKSCGWEGKRYLDELWIQ